MDCFRIEEEADRPACWNEMKYFRRVQKLEQINAFLGKLSNCSYRRTFRVYHHHGPAIEPYLKVITEKGHILEVVDIGDQRKQHEKELDQLHWDKRHRDRRYGRMKADMNKWLLKGSENVQDGLLKVKPEGYKCQTRTLSRKFG